MPFEDLLALLPPPVKVYARPKKALNTTSEVAVVGSRNIPEYPNRQGFLPVSGDDFQEGGAYPEIPIPQYPQGMGSAATSSSIRLDMVKHTVHLPLDSQGIARYEVLARIGHGPERQVQARPEEALPAYGKVAILPRPSEVEIAAELDDTRRALEAMMQGKISIAGRKQGKKQGEGEFVRYDPMKTANTAGQSRLVQVKTVKTDPLEPARFHHKRAPRPPPSPPAPVLHSPPRKLTKEEFEAWKIPPCVSSWKNPKGYTIPLDKRLAADGRGLQEHLLNDRFAGFTEALYVAEEHAREEVAVRSEVERRVGEREREEREEKLREMADQLQDRQVHLRRNLNSSRPPSSSHQPAPSDEAFFDVRLFDRTEGVTSGLADDEAYNLYEAPLSGRATGTLLTRPSATYLGMADDQLPADAPQTEDTRKRSRKEYDRLLTRDYSKSLQFEVDAAPTIAPLDNNPITDDPFGLDSFLSAAKSAASKKQNS